MQEDDGELDLHLDLSQLRTDTPKQFSKPPIPSYRTIPDDTTHSLWASEPLVREERREEPVQFDYNKIIQVCMNVNVGNVDRILSSTTRLK